jgi:hypothetical protein
MPDYGFISQVQTPNALSNIGSILQAANGAISLKKAQATLPAEIAGVQAQSQTAQTQAKSAAFKLSQEQAQRVQDDFNSIAQDPIVAAAAQEQDPTRLQQYSQKMQSLLDQHAAFARGAGVPDEVVGPWYQKYSQVIQQSPQSVQQLVAQRQQAGVGASGQVAQTQVPASAQQTPGTAMGPRGVPTVVQKGQFGTVQQNAMPVQGQTTNAPLTYPQGESPQTAAPLYALRDQAQAAAAQAPAQHFNNKQILDLTPDAFTGTGSGKLASVMNSVGLSEFIPKSAADIGPATAQLRHFIALQVENNASSMGANTDAARQLAANAVLPSDSPGEAIKKITKVNDAYVSGAEAFNKGMQAAITSPDNQKDIFAARDFQNQWSQTFDPMVYILKNAKASGDNGTIDRVLGKPGSKERASKAATYADKLIKLNMLTTAGKY